VATLARHLVDDREHHRIVIDPAADNAAAVRCYTAVGFRPVGLMRRYERDPVTGQWHDGLLMDLLADDLVRPAGARAPRPGPPGSPIDDIRPSSGDGLEA
jgi:aminoglycoside 6'-N-acetyltransferase